VDSPIADRKGENQALPNTPRQTAILAISGFTFAAVAAAFDEGDLKKFQGSSHS
jgi:hypothetical protein